MGKTWAAKCFRTLGVPVHDSDGCVHALLASDGRASRMVMKTFPDAKGEDGKIDRLKLGKIVFGDDDKLNILEAMLHPLVRDSQHAFLARHARAGRKLVVLDVPLLFESNARSRVDAVVVVSAPAFIQRIRAMRRRGMTEHKFNAILARQMPDNIKRRVGEFVVSTAGPRGQSLRRIGAIVKVTKSMKGHVWGPDWGKQ